MGALAAPRASTSWPRPQMASAFPRVSAGPLLLAVAVPFLFLHVHYQPDLGFSAGGTRVDITLSDLAVLAVALAGIAVAATSGLAPLRRGLPVWLSAAVAAGHRAGLALLPGSSRRAVRLARAPRLGAQVLRVRGARAGCAAARPAAGATCGSCAGALIAWSAVATTVGLLQYVGLVDQMLGHRPAEREPSLLGYHDFAALSGGALALGLAALLLREDEPNERPWVVLALAGGGLGLVISGAMTGVIGMWLAFVRARARGTAARAPDAPCGHDLGDGGDPRHARHGRHPRRRAA